MVIPPVNLKSSWYLGNTIPNVYKNSVEGAKLEILCVYNLIFFKYHLIICKDGLSYIHNFVFPNLELTCDSLASVRVLNRNLTGFQVNFSFAWPTMVVFPAFDLKTSTLVNCSAFRTIWSHKEYWIANQSLPNPSNKLRCRFSIKILSICVWILAVPWKTSSIKGFSIQIGFCLMFYCSSWQVVVSCTPWSISCTVTFLHVF